MRSILYRPYSAAAFALLLSASLLIGAWVFQYGFGYAPCQMCYWQRHAHKAVIALAVLALVVGGFQPRLRKPLLLLTILALVGSAALGFFHMGVEYKWWDGPQGCVSSGMGNFEFDPNDPLGALDKKIKPPACDEAVWHFIGLSMAAWNGIISLLGAFVTLELMRFKKAANDA